MESTNLNIRTDKEIKAAAKQLFGILALLLSQFQISLKLACKFNFVSHCSSAAFEVGDVHDLRIGEVERLLDPAGLVILHVEDDLGLADIEEFSGLDYIFDTVKADRTTRKMIFTVIGADDSLIQQLLLLVAHIGDEEAEEDMQLLNFGRQLRAVALGAVQQLHHAADGPAPAAAWDTGLYPGPPQGSNW